MEFLSDFLQFGQQTITKLFYLTAVFVAMSEKQFVTSCMMQKVCVPGKVFSLNCMQCMTQILESHLWTVKPLYLLHVYVGRILGGGQKNAVSVKQPL